MLHPLANPSRVQLLPADGSKPSASGNKTFVATLSSARELTHLRIDHAVTDIVARLVSGLSGWTLTGWGLNPLDDKLSFVRLFRYDLSPLRPAVPVRTDPEFPRHAAIVYAHDQRVWPHFSKKLVARPPVKRLVYTRTWRRRVAQTAPTK